MTSRPCPACGCACGWSGVSARRAWSCWRALLVPWSWVPGGHIAARPSRARCSPLRSCGGPRPTPPCSATSGWASLAVSLVRGPRAGLTALGSVAGRPAPRAVVGAGRCSARSRAGARASWSPCRSTCASRHNALDYGLTEQSLGGWLRDQGVSLLVTWVFAGGDRSWSCSARRGARRGGGRSGPGSAARVLTVLGSLVYPVVVEPLFNPFTSLPTVRCAPRSWRWPRRRGCRSTTCWWPTRHAVRRP